MLGAMMCALEATFKSRQRHHVAGSGRVACYEL